MRRLVLLLVCLFPLTPGAMFGFVSVPLRFECAV
jgi:hypothetical protein